MPRQSNIQRQINTLYGTRRNMNGDHFRVQSILYVKIAILRGISQRKSIQRAGLKGEWKVSNKVDIDGSNNSGKRGGALQSQSFASVARRYYHSKMSAFNSIKLTKSIGTKSITIGFTSYGNKHLYSDTFRRSKTFQKGDLLYLPQLLASSTYVGSSGLSKPRKDRITGFHYFRARLHGNHVFLNVAEETRVSKGRMHKIRYLYSVTDRIK